jgi:hypothetical protein
MCFFSTSTYGLLVRCALCLKSSILSLGSRTATGLSGLNSIFLGKSTDQHISTLHTLKEDKSGTRKLGQAERMKGNNFVGVVRIAREMLLSLTWQLSLSTVQMLARLLSNVM